MRIMPSGGEPTLLLINDRRMQLLFSPPVAVKMHSIALKVIHRFHQIRLSFKLGSVSWCAKSEICAVSIEV